MFNYKHIAWPKKIFPLGNINFLSKSNTEVYISLHIIFSLYHCTKNLDINLNIPYRLILAENLSLYNFNGNI